MKDNFKDFCIVLLAAVALVAAAYVLLTPYQSVSPKCDPSKPKCCPGPCTPNSILIQQGRLLKVQSILTGKQHPILQKAAEYHAAYQTRVQVQGHQNWENQRYPALVKAMPNCTEFREVANESWPGQDTQEAATEMYNSWKKSPGHWSCVDGKCSYYGYAMVLGRNGTWYACGIFADLR